MTGADRGQWPFTGRTVELAAIKRCLAAGRSVVLAGPAGVGKSRLALAAAPKYERVLATVAARTLPLGALAPLLPGHPPADNLLGWAERELLAHTTTLVVDDAHLLDAASAAVLQQLVGAGSLLVVATVRAGEPCPDAVSALWKDDLATRVDIDQLSEPDAVTLLDAVVPGRFDPATTQDLARRSGGNLLYLRELVIAAPQRGVPPRLLELIEERLANLTESERAGLELVALAEPLPLTMLLARVGEVAAEALESRGLIQVVGTARQPSVRMGHPLYGEAVRDGCTPLGRRRRYGQLLDALTAAEALAADPTRIALWHLESGRGAAPELFTTALRVAWAAHDYPLALRFGEAAMAAGGGPNTAVLYAAVLRYSGELSRAEALLAASWEQTDDQATQALLAATWINTLSALGRADDMRRVFDLAERAITVAEHLHELRFWRGLQLLGDGRYTETLAVADLILGAPIDPGMRAQVRMLRAWALVYSGRVLDAAAEAESVLSEREQWHADVPIIARSLYRILLLAARFCGDVHGSEAMLDRLHADLVAGRTWLLGSHVATYSAGGVHLLAGRVDAARRTLDGLDRIPADEGAVVAADLAMAHALAGDASAAEAVLAGAAGEPTLMRLTHLVLAAVRPWIAASRGDLGEAVRLGLAVADELESSRTYGMELAVRHDVVRFGAGHLVRERLAELTDLCQGPFAALAAAHAAADSAAALEQVAAGFADTGLVLLAAEAYAEAARSHAAADRSSLARAASARAHLLAVGCEGARTPALARLAAPDLTPREWEIAYLASTNLRNGEIAQRLVLSRRTVENHLQAAYQKLGVTNRSALAGLLDLPRSATG